MLSPRIFSLRRTMKTSKSSVMSATSTLLLSERHLVEFVVTPINAPTFHVDFQVSGNAGDLNGSMQH